MKKTLKIMLVLTLLLVSKSVMAQVALELKLNQKNYLLYDTVYAKIKLENYSGIPIVFGSETELKGEISFYIETPDKSVSFLIDEKITPQIENIILRPGSSATVTVPISKYYNMQKSGRYRVRAIVKHPRFTNGYQSNAMPCMLVKGITMYERTVGVPDVLNKSNKIATRTYRLVSYYDGADTVFNLVIEDKKNIYAIRKVGFQTGSLVPICDIDAFSKIHILNQVSPKIFSYLSFNIDGKLLDRVIYQRVKTMELARSDNGMITIKGGIKADPSLYQIVKNRTTPFDAEEEKEEEKEEKEKKKKND